MKQTYSLIAISILLFAALAGIGFAFTPPPPPPPPVPQSLGIYDTSIDQFQTNGTDQSACRSCHQSAGTNISGGYNNTLGGVDTRHHNMLPRGVINPFTNQPFGCQDCHPTVTGGNGILLDHSCTDCHNSTNFWADSIGAQVGNLNRPHHFNTSYDDANIGNAAANRTCNFCHGSFIDNYNDGHYVPTYSTSFMITPFANYKATNFSSNLSTVLFASDNSQVLNKEWGGCESCHLGNVNNSGIGPGATTPPVGSNHNNHHREILGGNVTRADGSIAHLGATTPFNLANAPGGRACFVCHVVNTSSSTGGPLLFSTTNSFTGETLPAAMEVRNSTEEQADIAAGAVEFVSVNGTITYNGTGCEKCHDVKSIHNIEAPGAGTTQGLGHIGNNTDCYGCHNSWLPADTSPMAGAIIPSLNSVTPVVISAGASTTLTISGGNFVNTVTNPDGTTTTYSSVVNIDGVSYKPSTITDSQIVVNIPALTAGTHQLQLVKGGSTLSKLVTLTVVANPTITSAKLGKQGGSNTLTISGNGFGNKPTTNTQYYVSVSHNGNQLISSSISKWTDNQISAKLPNGVTSGDTVTVLTTSAGGALATIK